MWRTVKLGDVIDVVMGQAPPGKACNKDGIGTPFVKAGEFGALSPVIKEWTTEPKKMGAKGDVFLCVVGATCGKINLGADCSIGRSVAALRPHEDTLLQTYLYYFMSQQVMRLRSGSLGAAQTVISKDMINSMSLPLPPLAEQQRIVAKLDAAFAEIDRAVVIEKAKLAEAEKLRAAYLDEKLKKLLHEKPVVCLSDVCERVSVGHVGTTSKYYCDNGIPFIRTQNVSKTGFDDTELRYITQEFHESLKKSQLKAGDVLLSRVVIDEMRTAIVPKNYGEANCANVILIRPKEKLLAEYLSLLIKSRQSQEYFMGVKKGAAQQVVNTGILKQWNIPLPSIDEQSIFVGEVTNSFEYVESLLVSVTEKKHGLSNLKSAILAQELQPPQSEAA